MAYCGPRGIRRSEFLSWPEDDQDAALAWLELDQAVCGRCGTEPADFDPEQGGDPLKFVASRRLCVGCELLDQEQDNLRSEIDEVGREAGFGQQAVLVLREQSPDYVPDDDEGGDDG